MSKGNTTENDIILKVFQATELSWSANANLYVALHSDDPGEGGNQTTNEITYTAPYARQAVARTSDGWDVSGNQALNDDLIQFPQCTGGSVTATHVSIGTLASGAGQILYSGQLGNSLAISTGIQPQFAANALTVTED